MRISTRQARRYVQERQEFKTHGAVYARKCGPNGYAVFSYGEHWPMHVWDGVNNRWLHNMDRYSITTSRHHNQTHPHQDHGEEWGCDALKRLVARLDAEGRAS